MCCLTSTKFLNLNVVFTKKASKLGGKPVVHSYAVILMLLGLFPEKFRDFLFRYFVNIAVYQIIGSYCGVSLPFHRNSRLCCLPDYRLTMWSSLPFQRNSMWCHLTVWGQSIWSQLPFLSGM